MMLFTVAGLHLSDVSQTFARSWSLFNDYSHTVLQFSEIDNITQRLQQSIYMHVFTDCFMKISLYLSEQNMKQVFKQMQINYLL